MTYGFQIINTSGVVQVDQDYKNYALFSKTTLSSWTGGWNTGTGNTAFNQGVSVPATGTYIVALQTDATSHAAVMAGGTVMAYNSASGLQPVVTVYVFAAPTASAESHGLRVFNASGEVVFDSGLKYMRVAYAGSIPSRNLPNDIPYTYSGLSSGDYAVVQAFNRQVYVSSPGIPGSWQTWRDWYNTTSTGFVVRNNGFFGSLGSTTGFANQTSGGPVLLIDVQGI